MLLSVRDFRASDGEFSKLRNPFFSKIVNLENKRILKSGKI